ncbi:MAG: mechanosensitive ion channel [Prevotella sp.]|nr:mechanosensitive ion channel [Prevotella sp.]
MEQIKIYVEDLLSMAGVSTSMIPLLRHVAMVVVTILLAWFSDWLCRRLFVPLVTKLTAKTDVEWDEQLFNRQVVVSACHIVPAIIVWQLLPMVFYQYPIVFDILKRITAIYITVMTTRTVVCLINAFQGYQGDGHRSNTQQYARSFSSVLKIILMFVAAIVVVAIILDRSPLTLFAGLGATSAILMLVFQDTITGLVAGIHLTSNDMLRKGDWITVEKAGVNGVVEDMTLTTVKVRNFDNTIVTISPKTLINESFQNWKGMQQSGGRRVRRSVCFDVHSVRVIDEELRQHLLEKGFFEEGELSGPQINLTLFRRYMERTIAGRDDVNEKMIHFVTEQEAGSNGIPVEFYFFLKQKKWVDYEHHMSDIMDTIYATSAEFGLTVHQYFPKT